MHLFEKWKYPSKIRENGFSLEKHFSLKTWKKRTIYRERVRIMKKLLFKKCQFSLFCQIDKNYCTSTVWKKGFTKNRKLSDFLRNCNLYTFHVKVRKVMWNYRTPQKFVFVSQRVISKKEKLGITKLLVAYFKEATDFFVRREPASQY